MATAKSTKSDYARRYRSTPAGAAGCAWNRITSRAGAKYGHRQCYAGVEVRMTREEFVAWATPRYKEWFAAHPGTTPSIDRIDPAKHYELGNLQLIAVEANRYKNSRHRNLTAPPGTRWCCQCQAYQAEGEFYRVPSYVKPGNPEGFVCYCKSCSRARSKVQHQAKK